MVCYEKLIGWKSDGASVMLGKRNSVVSRLKYKQPNLYVVHCVCHVAHLLVGDSIQCIPSYVTDLTENLLWWVHHSAKRVSELRAFQEWLEVEGNMILKKVDSRWLCLHACIWGEIGKIQSSTGKPYGLLSYFAKCLLCIPHGNADSERMFSCINLIKTDHRNHLETSTIQACLDIKLNLIFVCMNHHRM